MRGEKKNWNLRASIKTHSFLIDRMKKKYLYMSYVSESKVPKRKYNTAGLCKVSKNIPKWLEPRPNLLICLYNICVI